MDQKEFGELLKRYLQGDASKMERKLIEDWYQEIEPSVPPVTKSEKTAIKKRMQKLLKANIAKGVAGGLGKSGSQPFIRPGGLALRIAATITIILAVASAFFLSKDRSESGGGIAVSEQGTKWKEIENNTSYAHLLTLEDGSEITLEAGSVVEYPLFFDSWQREVRLKKGSAFFNISKDKQRPFYVYSYNVVTRVLGTSFKINSDQEGHVTVDVKSGSVSVSTRTSSNKGGKDAEIILLPNQRAAYDPRRQEIMRAVVDKPEAIIPAQEVRNMTFEKVSIAAIFKALEKAYQVKIRFDREIFSSCVLTTHLMREEDIYTRLKIICEAIGAEYHMEDGTIIITGKGC